MKECEERKRKMKQLALDKVMENEEGKKEQGARGRYRRAAKSMIFSTATSMTSQRDVTPDRV
jgi:hypothetical protein